MTCFYYKNQYTSDLQPKYTNLTINIIDVCNFSCSYCYNKKFRTHNVLDIQKLIFFIDYLQKRLKNPIKCDIIGGEPFLHKELLSFLAYLDENNIQFTIYTNASSSIETYINALNSFKHIKIVFSIHYSLFYATPYVSAIRKLKTIFSRLLVPSCELRIMFNPNIISIIDNIVHEFYDYSTVFPILDDSINYTADDIQKYISLSNICNSRAFRKNDIIIDEQQSYTMRDLDVRLVSNNKYSFYKNWLCFAGIDQLYVHSNGDVSPCEQRYLSPMPPIIGNIYVKDFESIRLHPLICTEKICDCQVLSKKIHFTVPMPRKNSNLQQLIVSKF